MSEQPLGPASRSELLCNGVLKYSFGSLQISSDLKEMRQVYARTF